MNDRYHGKRFASFLICCMLVTFGFFQGPPDIFTGFAQVIGWMYTLYLGGQSATDIFKPKNGG